VSCQVFLVGPGSCSTSRLQGQQLMVNNRYHPCFI
jgi:hypothetical protein